MIINNSQNGGEALIRVFVGEDNSAKVAYFYPFSLSSIEPQHFTKTENSLNRFRLQEGKVIMYDWLPTAMDQVKEIGRKHGVFYDFKLGPPALDHQISACEEKIGFSLPGSYQEFIRLYNGAELFIHRTNLELEWWEDLYLHVVIDQIDSVEEYYLWDREESEGSPIICIGSIFTGGSHADLGLDTFQPTDGNEYKVLYLYSDEQPKGIRRRPLANSFLQWISWMFAIVIQREEDPLYWEPFLCWDVWEGDHFPPSNPISEEDSRAKYCFADDCRKNAFMKLESLDYRGALEQYNLSLQVCRGDFITRQKRGLVLAALGDKQDALKDFTYTIDFIRGISSNAHDVLDPLEWYIGDEDVTEDDRSVARRGKTGGYLTLIYPDTCYHRAEVREKLGDVQGAIEDFWEAARVYQIKRQHEKAENAFEKASTLRKQICLEE